MENLKQVEITLPDRPGVLGELCTRLWGNGVSILACAIQFGEGCLSIRLSVDKPILVRHLTRYLGSVSRNQVQDMQSPETLGPLNTTSTDPQAEPSSKEAVCAQGS